MRKCERCGKPIRPHRWLRHEMPIRKTGIAYLLSGYEVSGFEYPVCDECSDAFYDFMHGKEIPAVERGCRSCGSLEAEGRRFCPDCGARVEVE